MRPAKFAVLPKRPGVATQMGNQGAATDAFREQVEMLQAGALGEVRDGLRLVRSGNVGLREPPTGEETPPATLAWDCWLGPASRPAVQPQLGLVERVARLRHRATGQLGLARHRRRLPRAEARYPVGRRQAAKSPRIRVRPIAAAESNAHCFPTLGDHRLRVSCPRADAAGRVPLVQRRRCAWFPGEDPAS